MELTIDFIMKRVINGLNYDTETATEICRLKCNEQGSDFRAHTTYLYKTAKGRFFIAGSGGPLSLWATDVEGGGTSSGSGVKPITPTEARTHMQDAECSIEHFVAVGLTVEDA